MRDRKITIQTIIWNKLLDFGVNINIYHRIYKCLLLWCTLDIVYIADCVYQTRRREGSWEVGWIPWRRAWNRRGGASWWRLRQEGAPPRWASSLSVAWLLCRLYLGVILAMGGGSRTVAAWLGSTLGPWGLALGSTFLFIMFSRFTAASSLRTMVGSPALENRFRPPRLSLL